MINQVRRAVRSGRSVPDSPGRNRRGTAEAVEVDQRRYRLTPGSPFTSSAAACSRLKKPRWRKVFARTSPRNVVSIAAPLFSLVLPLWEPSRQGTRRRLSVARWGDLRCGFFRGGRIASHGYECPLGRIGLTDIDDRAVVDPSAGQVVDVVGPAFGRAGLREHAFRHSGP